MVNNVPFRRALYKDGAFMLMNDLVREIKSKPKPLYIMPVTRWHPVEFPEQVAYIFFSIPMPLSLTVMMYLCFAYACLNAYFRLEAYFSALESRLSSTIYNPDGSAMILTSLAPKPCQLFAFSFFDHNFHLGNNLADDLFREIISLCISTFPLSVLMTVTRFLI